MSNDHRADVETMSDLESLMWTLDADPHLSSTFANLTLFDRHLDLDRLRARLGAATRTVPRLRSRVEEVPGPLAPRWVPDPDFDIDRHLRRIRLPEGSTPQDLHALAAELVLQPLDRNRPLWEFVVIEGLDGDRSAMVQRLHHTITDGEGGIKMSLSFIDLERDPPPPPPEPSGHPGSREDPPHRNIDALRRIFGSAADLARDPAQLTSTLGGLPGESAAMARSLARQFGVFDGHRSPLWNERTLRRSFHVHKVPLADVSRVARALGGSINDVFVAAAAGGAGAYHREQGVEVDELRMSMPVSTRSTDGVGGNAFTPTRVLVPVMADPRERFAEVHRRLEVTKNEKAMGFMATVAGLGRLVPSPLLVRIARQQVMTVDFTTSNLRAAPFDLYIAGARLEANHPLGPLVGTAWNLTTMSYRGELNLGLHVDAGAVEAPDRLAEAIWSAFDELLGTA